MTGQFKHRPRSFFLRGCIRKSGICNTGVLPPSLPGFSGLQKLSAPRPALQRLHLFSRVRGRIRGNLICLHKTARGHLDFLCEAVFSRSGFRCRSFMIHRRRQHALSAWVVKYWNKLPEEIMNASSVEIFKFRLDGRWQSLVPEVPL